MSVSGLGYVRCTTGACLPEHGYGVIGVDVESDKMKFVGSGNCPGAGHRPAEPIAAVGQHLLQLDEVVTVELSALVEFDDAMIVHNYEAKYEARLPNLGPDKFIVVLTRIPKSGRGACQSDVLSW